MNTLHFDGGGWLVPIAVQAHHVVVYIHLTGLDDPFTDSIDDSADRTESRRQGLQQMRQFRNKIIAGWPPSAIDEAGCWRLGLEHQPRTRLLVSGIGMVDIEKDMLLRHTDAPVIGSEEATKFQICDDTVFESASCAKDRRYDDHTLSARYTTAGDVWKSPDRWVSVV